MRIAQVVPPWLPVPPRGYGGVENVVATLTEGLVERGHDVTLFACQGSSIAGARLRAYPTAGLGTTCQVGEPLAALPLVSSVYRYLDEFDVVHDHTFPFGPALGMARALPPVVVHTVHVPPRAAYAAPVYNAVNGAVRLVAVSNAQAASCPHLLFVAVIPNGIRLQDFCYAEAKDDYLLFLGRMCAAKGVHLAIRAARELGRPLRIAAKMQNGDEIAYYRREVEPLLGQDVVYLGEVDRNERVALLQSALCTLVPAYRDEPFGLVMIESLACGTPVVALRQGPAVEIVEHGVTGYLADGAGDIAACAALAAGLDPADCRRAAEERFDARRMVAAYEALYERLLHAVTGP